MKVVLATVLSALIIVGLLVLATPRPTFAMTLTNGGDPALWPGQTLTGTVNVISRNGFAGVVTLSAQVIPAPITGSLIISFSPATAAVSPTSSLGTTLKISASSSVPAGQYTVILTGESSGIIHSIEVGLTINPLVSFYFTGLDSQVSGNILEVNGTYYSYSAVAGGLIVRQAYGEPLVYNWLSPVSSGSGNVYAWESTAGLSTTQNATVIDYASGSISANYLAESLSTVTFTESNLPAGTTWGVTVNGNHYTTTAGNPLTVTDVTLGEAYTYDTPLATSQNTEYTCACTGTVSSATINGAYQPQYYVTIGSNPSGTGTVSPGSGWFAGGAIVSLTASGTSHYEFTGWTETGSITLQNANKELATATINGPGTITANFVLASWITFNQVGMVGDASGTVLTVGSNTYTFAGFPLTLQFPDNTPETFAWTSPVSGASGVQYIWQSSTGLVTTQSGTFSLTGNSTITANYQRQYYVVMAQSPTNVGSVSPATGWFNANSQVPITATPGSGDSFSNWVSNTGAIAIASIKSASTTMTVGGPGTVTANFLYYITFQPSFTNPPNPNPFNLISDTFQDGTTDGWQLYSPSSSFGDGVSSSVGNPPDSLYYYNNGGCYSVCGAGGVSKTITLPNSYLQYQLSFDLYPQCTVSPAPTGTNVVELFVGGSLVDTISLGWCGTGFTHYSYDVSQYMTPGASLQIEFLTQGLVGSACGSQCMNNYIDNIYLTSPGASYFQVTVDGKTGMISSSGGTFYSLNGTTTYSFPTTIPYSNSEQFVCTASCSGSIDLQGTFGPTYQTQYYVEMYTQPSGAGLLSPGSGWFTQGSTVIQETPTLGVFYQWASTGSVTIANPNTASTTLTVNGAGTVEAINAMPPSSATYVQGASNACTVNGSPSTCTATLSSAVGVGDFIVIGAVVSAAQSATPALSVADTLSTPYSSISAACIPSIAYCTEFFYARAVNTGTDTITLTMTSISSGYFALYVDVYHGMSGTISIYPATKVCTSGCTTSISLGPYSQTSYSDYVGFALVATNSYNRAFTAGSEAGSVYTAESTTCSGACFAERSLQLSLTPTFPMSVSSGGGEWVEQSVIFSDPPAHAPSSSSTSPSGVFPLSLLVILAASVILERKKPPSKILK